MFPARVSLFVVSSMLSLISITVILSFRDFFFFVPLAGGISFREVFAFISQIGWVLLIITPPLLLRKVEGWSSLKMWLLISASSLYTLATLGIKVNNVMNFGDPFAAYLTTYPSLFFLEWLLPAFYVACAVMLRDSEVRSAAAARRSRLEQPAQERFRRDLQD